MNTTPVFTSQEGKEKILNYCDMLFGKITVPFEKLNINTRFGNTFIIAAGPKEAPSIVLLHGSSMNSVMWVSDIEKFSKKFRVYAPDMPGEPGRSVEKQLPFDTSDYTDWLIDVFNGLAIDKAVIMGTSLGAWLSAKFSINHADRVDKLVLLCPAGIGSQNYEFKDVALSLLSKGEKGIDELFVKINGDNPIPEIMLNYQKLIAVNFNSRKEIIPKFTDDELKSLTLPSILFIGAKDIMLNGPETVERYNKLVPNGKATLIPNRGHSLTGFAEDIMKFLATSFS